MNKLRAGMVLLFLIALLIAMVTVDSLNNNNIYKNASNFDAFKYCGSKLNDSIKYQYSGTLKEKETETNSTMNREEIKEAVINDIINLSTGSDLNKEIMRQMLVEDLN